MTHALKLPKIEFSPMVAGYLVIGVAAVGALYWLTHGGGRKTAAAIASLPGEVAAGTIEGIGDSLGVPRTNESACDAALREGRMWDASFACPAGRFIKGIFGGGEKPAPITQGTDTSGVPFY